VTILFPLSYKHTTIPLGLIVLMKLITVTYVAIMVIISIVVDGTGVLQLFLNFGIQGIHTVIYTYGIFNEASEVNHPIQSAVRACSQRTDDIGHRRWPSVTGTTSRWPSSSACASTTA
jgi:type III secretory pathway component EscR